MSGCNGRPERSAGLACRARDNRRSRCDALAWKSGRLRLLRTRVLRSSRSGSAGLCWKLRQRRHALEAEPVSHCDRGRCLSCRKAAGWRGWGRHGLAGRSMREMSEQKRGLACRSGVRGQAGTRPARAEGSNPLALHVACRGLPRPPESADRTRCGPPTANVVAGAYKPDTVRARNQERAARFGYRVCRFARRDEMPCEKPCRGTVCRRCRRPPPRTNR